MATAYENGVDVIVSAHEHFYERFAPMSPDGQRNDTRGIRQFIAHGILKLTLSAQARPSSIGLFDYVQEKNK